MKMMDVRHQLTKHPNRVYPNRTLEQIKYIVVHHSLTTSGSAEAYANYHVNTHGWPGIGYPFVIEKDGVIKICHDLTKLTYHVGNSNRVSVGICLTGDFRTQQPTAKQYQALLWLIDWLKDTLPNKVEIKGHSEMPGYAWKECPVIDMNVVRKQVAEYKVKQNEEDDDTLKLTEWQWQMLEAAILKLNLDSPEMWIEKIRNRSLTVSELSWLSIIIHSRYINL